MSWLKRYRDRTFDLTDDACAAGAAIVALLRLDPRRIKSEVDCGSLYPREHSTCPSCGTIFKGGHECPKKVEKKALRFGERGRA